MPRMDILFRLARTVAPDQPVPFSAERGRFADGVLVRDVEEVRSSGQATEEVPGGDMGFVVHHIAAGDLEIDRNRAVPAPREGVEQLLEVGPMVVVVTPGDCQPRLLPTLFFLGG